MHDTIRLYFVDGQLFGSEEEARFEALYLAKQTNGPISIEFVTLPMTKARKILATITPADVSRERRNRQRKLKRWDAIRAKWKVNALQGATP